MKTLLILFLISFNFCFSQSNIQSSSPSSEDLQGYTYDYDIVFNLLIDQKVNSNNNESICFKELVNSIGFPDFDSKNNLDKQILKTWIESHPNQIILALKKAKRFDVLTEY
tara:strand:+ start:701 stop:1033 length:333 start_codon:yes stop_codon:yes gene_type:complete